MREKGFGMDETLFELREIGNIYRGDYIRTSTLPTESKALVKEPIIQ